MPCSDWHSDIEEVCTSAYHHIGQHPFNPPESEGDAVISPPIDFYFTKGPDKLLPP
jgi:hypothetical protein